MCDVCLSRASTCSDELRRKSSDSGDACEDQVEGEGSGRKRYLRSSHYCIPPCDLISPNKTAEAPHPPLDVLRFDDS